MRIWKGAPRPAPVASLPEKTTEDWALGRISTVRGRVWIEEKEQETHHRNRQMPSMFWDWWSAQLG